MANHVAIFIQPYIDMILSGEKTIESRFSKIKCAPFEKVNVGDRIFMKESGGYALGYFIAGTVEYFSDLDKEKVLQIDNRYRKQIFCDDTFFYHLPRWFECKYATIIHVGYFNAFEQPKQYKQKGRKAWIEL